MISDVEFESFDAEVGLLFREAEVGKERARAEFEAGITSPEHGQPDQPNEERVERIVAQAQHEAVIKDTADFFFRSFGPALVELLNAIIATLAPDRIDGGNVETGESPPEKDSPS